MRFLGIALLTLLIQTVLLRSTETLRYHREPYVGIQNAHKRLHGIAFQPSARINGGEIVTETRYAPWQVSLQNQYRIHFCGGAIITNWFVVTAASCVAGLQTRNIRVVAGTHNWQNAENGIYEVSEIILHCNFDKPLYHNDIALLKLKNYIRFNEVTQKISLPEEDELQEGDNLTMTGWGSWVLGQEYPVELKKLEVRYVPFEKCKTQLYNTDDVDIGHLCTYSRVGEGACHGDTGGPIVDAQGQLVGVGNWGMPCGAGFPDVSARLYFYKDWIRTIIDGCGIPE